MLSLSKHSYGFSAESDSWLVLVIVFRTGDKNTNHEKERAKYAGGEKGGGACRRKRSLIAL